MRFIIRKFYRANLVMTCPFVTTQEAHNAFQQAVRGMLKPYRFKGRAGQWHKRLSTGTLSVNRYCSKYGAKDWFTYLICFGADKIYEQHGETIPQNGVSSFDGHFVARLGWFNAVMADAPIMIEKPWRKGCVDDGIVLSMRSYVTQEQFDEQLENVRQVLMEIALPEALKWEDEHAFVAFLRNKAPLRFGQNSGLPGNGEVFRSDDPYFDWLADSMESQTAIAKRGYLSF